MKKIAIGAVAVAVVGGAGFGLTAYPQMKAKQEVDKLFASLPQGSQGSYKTVDYSLFSNKLVVTGIEVTSTGDKADTVKIGSLELEKPDFAAQKLVFDPASYQGDKRDPAYHALARSVTATDIALKNAEGSFSLGRVTVNDLAAKQFQTIVPPTAPAEWTSDAVVTEMNRILAYSRAEVLDYGVEMKDAATVKVGGMTATDLKDGKLGGFQAKAISVESKAEPFRMSIAEISGEKLEYSADAPFAFVDPDGVSRSIPGVNLGRMAFSGIEMAAPDQQKIRLKEIVLADLTQKELIPTSMSLGIHGLEIETASITDQEARDMLVQLGYDRLALNIDLAFTHATEAKRLTVKKMAIGSETMGQVSLTAELNGIPAFSPSNPAAAMAAVETAALDKLELRYDDASLAGRVIKMMAAEQQIDEAMMRGQLIEMLDEQKAEFGGSPISLQAMESIIAFLKEPKSLSVKAQPAQPVLLQHIMAASEDPDSLANAIKLSVSANQ